MAVGSLLATLGSTALQAGASAGINALLGGNSGGGLNSSGVMDERAFRAFSPQAHSSGLVATPFANGGRGYNLSLGPGLTSALSEFRSLSEAGANQLGRLQSRLAPGFSDLRQAGLARLNANRTRTVGDLRGDLARRRVLGSSFANDTIARAEAEFALQEADFSSRTFLQEIDATVNLINQQNDLRLNAVSQELAAQSDLANISASLITGLQNNMTALAQTNAQIAAQNAANNAAGLGAFFQPAIDQLGSGFGNWIGSVLGGGNGAMSESPGGG